MWRKWHNGRKRRDSETQDRVLQTNIVDSGMWKKKQTIINKWKYDNQRNEQWQWTTINGRLFEGVKVNSVDIRWNNIEAKMDNDIDMNRTGQMDGLMVSDNVVKLSMNNGRQN